MAKRDDNFGFDTDSKPKAQKEINLEFLNNIKFLDKLTYKQKEIVFFSAIIAVIIIIAIAFTLIVIGVNGGFAGTDNNSGGNTGNGGTSAGGENAENGETGDNVDNNEPDVDYQPTHISIASNPKNTIYYKGDTEPNYSGLVISVSREDATNFEIPYDDYPELFTFTGFDSSKATEKQKITVEYKGQTANFYIEIKDRVDGSKTIESITVNPMPKTTYKVGEPMDYTGARIECTYSNEETKVIRLDALGVVIHYEPIAFTPGTHEVKVEYFDTDSGGYAFTFITITIEE